MFLLYPSIIISIFLPFVIALFANRRSAVLGASVKISAPKYINIPRLILAILVIASFGYFMFSIQNFRHNDELGYVRGIVQANVWNGRFFPLGHQEFRFISIDNLGGNFSLLYVPNIIQVSLIVLCLYVLTLKGPLLSYIIMLAMLISTSIVAYTNLVVPERNAFFFVCASLCSTFFYYRSGSRYLLALSLLFASVSCYYKEPVVLFWLSQAVVIFVIIKMGDFSIGDIQRLKPLAFGLIISSLLFVINYFVFAILITKPSEIYANSGGGANSAIVSLFQNGYVPCAALALILLFFLKKSIIDVMLICIGIGGLSYASALAFLNLSVAYYYIIPYMSLAALLARLAIFNGMIHKNSFFFGFLKALILFSFVLLLVKSTIGARDQLLIDRANQFRYEFLKAEFSDLRGYRYIKYNNCSDTLIFRDYQSTMIKNYIEFLDPKKSNLIELSSESGCYPWSSYSIGDNVNCTKESDVSLERVEPDIILWDECSDEFVNNFLRNFPNYSMSVYKDGLDVHINQRKSLYIFRRISDL